MINKNSRSACTVRCLSFLVLGLTAFLILIIAPWQEKKREKPERILARFEAFLQEHEDHIRKEIASVSDNVLGDSLLPLPAARLSAIPEPGDQEMTLFIYQEDSLIYWSDNRVPFSLAMHAGAVDSPDLIRLANGWYERLIFRKGIFTLAGLCLVKQEYPFQNQYLRNHYIGTTDIPEKVGISLAPGKHNVSSSGGAFLCSLDIPDNLPPPADQTWLTLFLMLSYLFLILFLYEMATGIQTFFKKPLWPFLLLAADVILLRGIQFAFRWPEALYRSELFSPGLYSSSGLFPSLGDFLVNSFLILIVAALFYRSWHLFNSLDQQATKRLTGSLLRFAISLAGLILVMIAVSSLVTHSTLPMNLENVSQLSWNSLPAFASIGFLALAWIFVSIRLALPAGPEIAGFADANRRFPIGWFFLAVVLFSLCATLILNRSNSQREENQRELLAMRLSARQNPVTELLLQQTVTTLETDSAIGRILAQGNGAADLPAADDSTVSYLLKRYFREYWNNFSVQVTVCRASKILRIQPQGFEVDCSDYFEGIIYSFGRRLHPEIYLLDYGYGNQNYLARIAVPGRPETLYLEISSRGSARDLGYPELLVDRSTYDFPDPGDYSYAFYRNNHLVHRVGEYAYGFDLAGYMDTVSRTLLPARDRMDHFLYPINAGETLIISKPIPTWLNIISPFSYLLIILLVFGTICQSIINLSGIRALMIRSLRNRLQLSMLGMILTLFIITGVLMMVYLFWLNGKKNEENLKERTLSILIEVEHKFDRLNDLRDTGSEELENVLIKFSNVFFSDINLFDPKGILIATSRPRIFREGLTSDLINRPAFTRLQDNTGSMFVQIEHIGELSYLSAYVPFYNTQNRLLGYLNLPYFSRQDDLRREISTFLVAFVNIYLLFILLGVLVTYLVSTYITSPLKLLAQRISRIHIGFANDKLIWKREDEIGKLVEEYNRMLDQLAVSAEKLAFSERQSAWREMAQQVAHEIKNPLTPMRLGVQYLQKAWEDRAGDWEIRLHRFTEALLAQIDTLSAIASEFSYFARMPEPEKEILSLDELVNSALAMYQEVPAIRLIYHPGPGEKWVYADRRQLLRVFGNLLNNAVEAIEARTVSAGEIVVETASMETGQVVRITDNGKGIRPEEAERIFQPNFTTRSGGAGLGLAIVKAIVDTVGGTVSFVSDPGKMTTFTVCFPSAAPSGEGQP